LYGEYLQEVLLAAELSAPRNVRGRATSRTFDASNGTCHCKWSWPMAGASPATMSSLRSAIRRRRTSRLHPMY
jgi:hypothetical protein